MNRMQRFSISGGLLLICYALLLGASSRPSGSSRDVANKYGSERTVDEAPVVIGHQLKLEIIQIKRHPNDVLEVIIKNGYPKNITAIAASTEAGQTFNTDYIYAESEINQRLAPGATDMFLFTPMRRLDVV